MEVEGVIYPRWPGKSHARTSGPVEAVSTNASNVTVFTPRRSANRTSAGQRREGMPRRRQRLTVGVASDSADATACVPPSESMTEPGVTMDSTIVCTMQTCQGFAAGETTFGAKYGAIGGMIDPRDVIAGRLDALRKELGIETDTKFATEIGLDKATYSLIKNLKRELSFETACRIREKYGISLDWLYYGDLQQSAVQTMMRIGRGPAAKPQAEPTPARSRKRA